MENHIPEGMASSEIKIPVLPSLRQLDKKNLLAAGWRGQQGLTTAEGEGWGRRRNLCRGWSRAQEGSRNFEEGITPKAGMHSLECAQGGNCRVIQARNKWERGRGSAWKVEHGKNLWNDLEKKVRNVPSTGIRD